MRGSGSGTGYVRRLPDELQRTDVLLWNRTIRKCTSSESAMLAYSEMRRRGLHPDRYTLPFLVKTFTRESASSLAEGLHAHAHKFGLVSNAFARSALINAYCLSGEVAAARVIFEGSDTRDVVMWNAMISGCNRNRRYRESCELLNEMAREKRPKPSSVTFLLALCACSKLKLLSCGKRIHQQLLAVRLEPGNLLLENALVCMYAECGDMDSALKLFENMKVKDVISWTCLIKGFSDSGNVHCARSLFEEMPHRDLICWTAMIDGHVKANKFKEALELFRRMQRAGVQPDAFAIVGALTACAHLGALEAGEWVRIYVARSKIPADIVVLNALIDMYSKCGAVDKALELFSGTKRRDQFTWTAMITGLAVNGRGEEAIRLFDEMLLSGEKPDGVTFVGVLQACAHSGMVDKGKSLFSNMARAHGVEPEAVHYGCMVDLLGRAGLLREALDVVHGMPVKANSIVLGSLLGACSHHRDAEMAEAAAAWLLEVDPGDGAADTLLLNVYGGCGRWEEVRQVRERIAEKGARKTPGCSLVETQGEMHEFVAGDSAHPMSSEIADVARSLGRVLALAGSVPDARGGECQRL